MDKTILFVKSDIQNVKSERNKNLVSFHKQQILSFNKTTLEQVNLQPGMYASFYSIDRVARVLTIEVRKNKVPWEKSAWYKITNPKVSKHNKYCYIRTTNLLHDFGLVLYGAFEYKVSKLLDSLFIDIYY